MSETVLNKRYRLDEQIGEGGMAVVYRGQDLVLNRQVAVKILRPQYAADAGFLKRFEREAQSAAGFSHPNIVSVYDVGSDLNQHYIVMEYIRGPNLKELIRRQGPFSVDGAIFIINQVASALEYAHERGLIHRDIKPQNVLVDRDGNAKVVDFGIAKGVRDTNLTEAGTGMGTVHYVSPEQANGNPATPASDLYSTGVVLYEMLTKRLPFEADTPIGVAMLHVNQPPPPLRQFNPEIPPQVEALVLRALAKNPADRFPSAAAFANALRHWDSAERVPSETTALPSAPTVSETRVIVAPQPQRSTPPVQPAYPRVSGARVATPQKAVAAPRKRLPADEGFRDDVGCATWLIGSAILLGIIGLVLLAFRVVPALLDDDGNSNSGVVSTLPTPTIQPATPTPAVTATIASVPTTAATTVSPLLPTNTAATSHSLVPDLTGMSVSEAQSAVDGVWELATVDQVDDATPAGLIISQSPGPGASLADGELITAYVSAGAGVVDVPPVVGLATDDAIAEIVAMGFDYTVVDEPSIDFAPGIVIRTEPDTTAEAGATIVIVASLGDVVLMPNVIGLDAEIAAQELDAAGLFVGEMYYADCPGMEAIEPSFDCATFPENTVALASAPADVYVPRGSTIDLTIYTPGT